jgi:hypothetical protein
MQVRTRNLLAGGGNAAGEKNVGPVMNLQHTDQVNAFKQGRTAESDSNRAETVYQAVVMSLADLSGLSLERFARVLRTMWRQ